MPRLKREDRRYFYLMADDEGDYGKPGYVSKETNKRKKRYAFALIVGAEWYTNFGMRNFIFGSNLSRDGLEQLPYYGLSSKNIYTSILRECGTRVTEAEARAQFPGLAIFEDD